MNKSKSAYNQMIAKMEGVDECFEQLTPVSVIDADITVWWNLKLDFFLPCFSFENMAPYSLPLEILPSCSCCWIMAELFTPK